MPERRNQLPARASGDAANLVIYHLLTIGAGPLGCFSTDTIASADTPDLFERPIDQDGFAVNIVSRHETPTPAIARRVPVISKDEIFIRRDNSEVHRVAISICV